MASGTMRKKKHCRIYDIYIRVIGDLLSSFSWGERDAKKSYYSNKKKKFGVACEYVEILLISLRFLIKNVIVNM